ncbi:MAG: hypothetical protein R6W86_00900 [Marinobacter sp.]|uniref:hypothetical protein n=1 Tax=Marinobacter sp. TaxID=50741 RepID=UPI00396E64E3
MDHHRHHRPKTHHPRHKHRAVSRDHGEAMFIGYEFRVLHNELERAEYSPKERKILIRRYGSDIHRSFINV